jgi:hypothetical protein
MEDRKRFLKLSNRLYDCFTDFTGTWKKLNINSLDSMEKSWYNLETGEIFNQGDSFYMETELTEGRKFISDQVLNDPINFLEQQEMNSHYVIIYGKGIIPYCNNSEYCKTVPAINSGNINIEVEGIITPNITINNLNSEIKNEIQVSRSDGGRILISTFMDDLLISVQDFYDFEIVEISKEEFDNEVWKDWKPLKIESSSIP